MLMGSSETPVNWNYMYHIEITGRKNTLFSTLWLVMKAEKPHHFPLYEGWLTKGKELRGSTIPSI